MNQTPQSDRPTIQLPKDFADLLVLVNELPEPHRSRLEPVMNRCIEQVGRRKRILSLIQEALSQLRMDMKYLMFDLEATRRERDALRGGK